MGIISNKLRYSSECHGVTNCNIEESVACLRRSISKYYVRKKDKELVNVRFDHWVEFRFDQNNRLTAIYAQNIEGIKNQP